jgi:uncharacterized protein (DUF885 family)
MSAVRDLADETSQRVLAAQPLLGTELGLREYDALLPDESTVAQRQLADDLERIDDRAEQLHPDRPDERITLGVIRSLCSRTRAGVEIAASTYTVTPMPIAGPPALFATAARTVLADPEAAEDYLSRLRAGPRWIDQLTTRLREGRDDGRAPVASLVDNTIRWCDHTLAEPIPRALASAGAPDGWDRAAAWRSDVDAVIADELRPALTRWRELLAELRPNARDDEHAGIGALPNGDELYRRCIAVHTTLELSADELHQIGRDAVAALEERALELGDQLGLRGLEEIVAAVRTSAEQLDPQDAMAAARAAIARAEDRAPEIMAPPLPEPCAVKAMPSTVAEVGMAPHYTRPRADSGRPGTFWFNTVRATAGTGWDLEAVAFHEAVPGHHSQLARLQQLDDLPLLQQFSVTAHSEGWGLYAELLADEFDLYSDVRAQLGAVYIAMHRAARLVVDTGIHAKGWSRERARRYLVEHVALPEQFLADEVDRYVAWPGQALAYLTGQREILRLRAGAEQSLGVRFALPGFHCALLDSGSLPLPVLATAVDDWVASENTKSGRGANS